MKPFIFTLLALIQSIALCSGSFFHSPMHQRLHSIRSLHSGHVNSSDISASVLQSREDYTCGVGRPCSNEACCGATGNCGYGSAYCGAGCTSNCGASAECGKDSKDGKTTCPLNTCCSQFGFCGTTKEFCGDGCQTNCVLKPSPPPGSTTGKTLSKVIGYYEAWNARSACHKTLPADLPLDVLTHLNYAFAYLDPDTFGITTMDAATPVSLFEDFSNLKLTNPNLKLFVSIGGWTFSDSGTYTQPIFGNIARSATNRQKFADQLLKFLNHYGFDGVDLDWEYPGAPDRGGSTEDTANYVLLVKTLRENFSKSGRDLGISFTAPSSFWYLRWIDLPGMMKYCDWVNLMSYDLHGTWDSSSSIGSIVQAHTNLTEIKLAVDLFWRVQIPPHQIALGFGFYGRAFTLSNPSCTTPGCPFSGGAKPGPCTATSGYLAYYEVQDILTKNPGIKVIHDEEAAVKYFSWDNNQWISYDDQETFKQKITWADSIGLSGSLIWASDLDDFDSTAHAALTGKTISTVGTQLSKKQVQAQQMTVSDLESYLMKDCYVQPDSLTACRPGDSPVGYDKDGRKKDYKPICCPKTSGMTECQWRGGNGGTNAGRDCNGQCHSGEVMITQSSYGGTPGESSETAHCTRGKKAFCCQLGSFTEVLGQCHWTNKVSSQCDSKTEQKVAYMWDKTGWGTTLSHGNEYCCPKDDPPPLLDCRWVGKGDCADNTCGGSEVTLMTDGRGDTYGSCSWGRKKSLCCTPNPEALLTENCDIDLCSLTEYKEACEDESGFDEDTDTSPLDKRSYVTNDGKILWSYYDVDSSDSAQHWKRAGGRTLPGLPRTTTINLANLLHSAIYKDKTFDVISRHYWPGLKSLKGDGSETLIIKGGFSMVKDSCASTVLKFIPAGSLPKTGFQMEHIREINMLTKFATSLITGKLQSGGPMKHTFDPIAIWAGWNKYYDVSLPPIGATVKDAVLYTIPRSFNDRIHETIGSYAYRAGISFVPGPINLVKKSLLSGEFPLGVKTYAFKAMLNQVANSGNEVVMKQLLEKMQLTIATFNYLNDAVLHRGFTQAGLQLAKEMSYASQYIPELKGIDLAWAEWEPDFYATAVAHASTWLASRSGLVLQKFPTTESLTNPAVMKLVSETIRLVAQSDRIKSPLDP